MAPMGAPLSDLEEGDERRAVELIEDKMESMRLSIEELEDAIVLMRQALVPHPSDQVPVTAPHAMDSTINSKKEKKSRRTKLGKRHASSPSLMVHEIPDERTLQPLPSPAKSKKSTAKSIPCPPSLKASSSKHSRDDSSSTIVPEIIEPDSGGAHPTSGSGSGKSTIGRIKRSHSHSGAKLFEQLFHKRSLHRSGHRNTISIPSPTHLLNTHSAPTTPLPSSPLDGVHLERPDFPILDPMSILREMELQISNLRHQHSSMLTLLPLSVLSSSRSNTLTKSETSSSHYGSEHDYFGTPTQGSRRQSLASDVSQSPPQQGSSLISPKGRLAQLDNHPSELPLGETERVRFDEPQTQKQREKSPRRHHHHHHEHHQHRPDPKHGDTHNREHQRKNHHKSRASLSSLYAEVASIYYDADLGDESEEAQTPIENTGRISRHDTHHVDELERVLQREVSRQSEHSHDTAKDSADRTFTTDASSPTTPRRHFVAQNTPVATVPIQPYSGRIVRRTALPAPAPKAEPSLIGMLKKNVGKDMSTISFDVTFNEPISLLQKLAEEVEYFDLLRLANAAIDSTERLAHVAAFAVSQYASAKYRTVRKPFNPLQGETYELYREDLGLRFISEKVTHHPPRFAAKADGNGWTYACTSAGKNRLAGMSLEIQPLGAQHVTLTDKGERYTWTKPLSYMRNLIAGTKYLETIGEMVVTNETNGERCIITFKDAGWSGAYRNHVAGICYKADGKTKAAWIDGVWDSHLDVRYGGPKDPAHPLWIVHPWPAKPEVNYGFTKWAIQLNELTPDLVGVIAPSDSRLRPDQRLLEEGRFTEADRLKASLEEVQRKRRNEGHEVQPRWFKASSSAEDEWSYAGGYWEARETHTLQQKAVTFLFETSP